MIGALLLRAGIPRTMAAQSRRDLAAMSRLWADDIVMEWSGPSVIAGRFEGREAVADAFRRDWAHLAASEFRPVAIGLARPYAMGLSNVALVQFVVEVTTTDGRSGRIEGVTVSAMRRGRVVAIRNHYFDPTVCDAIFGPAPATSSAPAESGLA